MRSVLWALCPCCRAPAKKRQTQIDPELGAFATSNEACKKLPAIVGQDNVPVLVRLAFSDMQRPAVRIEVDNAQSR